MQNMYDISKLFKGILQYNEFLFLYFFRSLHAIRFISYEFRKITTC